MSNVISFCDYKQKKIEEKISLWDNMDVWSVLDNLTTATFTVTIDDETFKINLNTDDFE